MCHWPFKQGPFFRVLGNSSSLENSHSGSMLISPNQANRLCNTGAESQTIFFQLPASFSTAFHRQGKKEGAKHHERF